MRAGRIAAVLSILFIAGCDDETGPNVSGLPSLGIQRVEVVPSSMTILVADTITEADVVQFSAVAFNRAGAPISISDFAWRTSDETIALIDGTGLVIPLRPGTVEIHASAHKIGKATLVILPATERVEVTPARDTILVDEPIVATRDFIKLQARAFDPDGELRSGVAFTWQSNANNVVTVDEDGTVHATGLGSTSVLASSNNIFAGSQILVAPVVASVSVTAPVTQALVSDTIELTAIARNYDGAEMPRTFNWTTSNPSVATVSASGVVNVVGVGQATITARTAHREASVNITTQERKLLSVEGGRGFTCAVANLGRGYCWGLGLDGRIGSVADSVCFPGAEGSASPPCAIAPKRLDAPEVAYTSIAAGGNFGCGVSTTQMLYCWGNDVVGQLGNGLGGTSPTPGLATVKSERFTAVTAGSLHACALNLVGTAYCWGSDSEGQLGDHRDGSLHSTTPIPVADTTLSFKAISTGDAHTCAITQSGQAYCWGRGDEGQLGRGSTTDSETPVQVSGGNTFTAIAAGGSHTCGVTTGGAILCWGDNSRGQLGTGGFTTALAPTAAAGAGGYTAVVAGEEHTCGLAGAVVRCWGSSEFGQIGDGSFAVHNVASPVAVQNLQAVSITAGYHHTCAMGTDGNAWCWGSNRWGALGNEFQAAIRPTPQLVARPR